MFVFTLLVAFGLAFFVQEKIFIKGTFLLRPDWKKSLGLLPLPTKILPTLIAQPTMRFITEIPPTSTVTLSPISLAQCLTDKGYIMYGTKSCPSCALQKSYFGDSFQNIRYIDCESNLDLCRNKNIRSYPTWETRDGKQYKGAIPLAKLAELSGCTR